MKAIDDGQPGIPYQQEASCIPTHAHGAGGPRESKKLWKILKTGITITREEYYRQFGHD